MNDIKNLNKEDLITIQNFIFDEKKEFIALASLGWNIKNIENHFNKKMILNYVIFLGFEFENKI